MSDQSDDMSDQLLVWPDIMSDHFKKVIIVSVVKMDVMITKMDQLEYNLLHDHRRY